MLVFITSSIGPISRISFLSVGMNLTLTFCSCRNLSLNAESCPVKSNSYGTSMQQIFNCKNHHKISKHDSSREIDDHTSSISYVPSSPRDSSMSSHLPSQQKADNLQALLHIPVINLVNLLHIKRGVSKYFQIVRAEMQIDLEQEVASEEADRQPETQNPKLHSSSCNDLTGNIITS